MTITLLPTPPARSQAPATFIANADAFLAALPTFGVEANALASSLNAIAAGGATAIPYIFSTTTTDSDPGNGILRLDNATQASATTIRADLLGNDGITWTSVLDTFDDSTSTVTGQIMLTKSTDASKWLYFNVTAVASPSGYKNITVTNVSSSGANPFSNGDPLVLKFSRTGDKGNTGPVFSIGDHEVVVHTGNGHGSTNTKIRRFTTTLTSVGTAITYADSATLGGSFTINESGIYSIHLSESSSGSPSSGVSLNSAQLTTSIPSISIATRLMIANAAGTASLDVTASRVVKLTAGDVVRFHGDGAATGTSNITFFAIRKVSLS